MPVVTYSGSFESEGKCNLTVRNLRQSHCDDVNHKNDEQIKRPHHTTSNHKNDDLKYVSCQQKSDEGKINGDFTVAQSAHITTICEE